MPAIHRIRKDWRAFAQAARATATPWRQGGAVAMAVLVATPLAACGSASSSNRSSSAALKRACKQVEAVLSDGPEPAADPIGYAQAQVLPLRQIDTADRPLRKAIDGLASAYAAFSAANGAGHHAKSAVRAAVGDLNAICPGAAS
jgi:hypothetical protein